MNKTLLVLAAILFFVAAAIILSVLAIPAILGVATWVAYSLYCALADSEIPRPNY